MEERAELLRRVRRVRLATRIRVRGTITGQHRSIFGGSGLELTDLREYQPGDDLRAIDWKVTARYARPYVREFAEDREQTFYLAVDRSFCAEAAVYYRARGDGRVDDAEAREIAEAAGRFFADLEAAGAELLAEAPCPTS